jgi:hypothetical protein
MGEIEYALREVRYKAKLYMAAQAKFHEMHPETIQARENLEWAIDLSDALDDEAVEAAL